jgi:hypothetical protein
MICRDRLLQNITSKAEKILIHIIVTPVANPDWAVHPSRMIQCHIAYPSTRPDHWAIQN